MRRTKYNVGMNTEKRTFDGRVFDSVMEMRYYRDVILPGVESGRILKYELQKEYVLQPKFTHDGRDIRPILYIADFYVEYADGSKEIIDIKGAADSVAKIKRKMMWYIYRDIPYKWITYVRKWGGWVDYDTVERKRKEARKTKKMEEQTHEQEQEADV